MELKKAFLVSNSKLPATSAAACLHLTFRVTDCCMNAKEAL